MKILLLAATTLFMYATAFAQKGIEITAGANVSLPTNNLGFNDVGIGAQIHGALGLTHSQLKLGAEVGVDKFIGDNSFYSLPDGQVLRYNPHLVRLLAGPETALHPRLSAALLGGVFFKKGIDNESTEGGFKVALIGHLGKLYRWSPTLAYLNTFKTSSRYLSAGFGYTLNLRDQTVK